MKTDFYNRSMFYGADAKTLRAASFLRKNMTLAELILWKKLKEKGLINTKFRRQHAISNYIVDFYCHEHKFVIEVDGEIHDNIENQEYDLSRTSEIKEFGIKIIRFTNDEVIFHLDEVIKKIREQIA